VGEADHREFCRPSNLPWTPGSPWPTYRRGSSRWRASSPSTPVLGQASSWRPRGSTCRRAYSRLRAFYRHPPSSSSRASGASPRQRGFGRAFASVKVAFLAFSFSHTSSSARRAAGICPSAWRPSYGGGPLAPPHSTACLRRLMRPQQREPQPPPLQPRDPPLQQREPPPPGLTHRFPAPHPSEVAADLQAEARLLPCRFPAPHPSAHPQAGVRLLPRCHRKGPQHPSGGAPILSSHCSKHHQRWASCRSTMAQFLGRSLRSREPRVEFKFFLPFVCAPSQHLKARA
jgi:hypothetical protein